MGMRSRTGALRDDSIGALRDDSIGALRDDSIGALRDDTPNVILTMLLVRIPVPREKGTPFFTKEREQEREEERKREKGREEREKEIEKMREVSPSRERSELSTMHFLRYLFGETRC